MDRGAFSSHYLSPSTKGITVNVTGPASVKKAAGLTVGASGCKSSLMTLQCELKVPGLQACPTARPCYDASVATYDAYDSKTRKIPRGAHALSADEHFTFAIASGTTTVPLVLQGIPKSIAFVPSATSTLTGNQKVGFVEPKCPPKTQHVNVTALDADGNYIVGAGAPGVSLKSRSDAQFAVVPEGANAFELRPPVRPGYPFGNVPVALTARATPGASSGAKAVTATFSVAYSGDICGILTEFPLPTASSVPFGLTAGPDGALWFSEAQTNKIGRITPSGKIVEFSVTAGSDPGNIVTGPDKNIWYTEFTRDYIGRITTRGALNEFPVPTSGAMSLGIAVGPDGNLWFTENHSGNIGRATTSGVVTEFLPHTSNSQPRGIVAGPNDQLWYTECNGNLLASITTQGVITEYPALPVANSNPDSLATGPNGTLWFTERGNNTVAVVNSAGTVTSTFVLPETSSAPGPITLGPDGAYWFSEEVQPTGRIGRITLSGAITEFPVPTANALPYAVVVGPDGAIWFTEALGNKIGRIR